MRAALPFLTVLRSMRRMTLTLVGGFFLAYFLYHTIAGDRGLMVMTSMRRQVADAQDFLSTMHEDRLALERRVKAMRPGQVDSDLLEEQNRKQLNGARPNEIILMMPDTPSEPEKPSGP